jgi:hypothetical protein
VRRHRPSQPDLHQNLPHYLPGKREPRPPKVLGEDVRADCHLRAVAHVVARRLRRFLSENPAGSIVGCSFGYGIEMVVSQFEWEMRDEMSNPRRRGAFRKMREATFFPCMGDFGVDREALGISRVQARPLRYCASAHALRLARAVGSDRLVDTRLPGWIPIARSMSVKQLRRRRALFWKVHSEYGNFDRIFGRGDSVGVPDPRKPPLIRSCHVLLTSCGSNSAILEYLRVTSGEIAAGSGIVSQSLRNSVGDMSCLILPRGGYPAGSNSEPALMDAFIGPRLRDFRQVSAAARVSPGKLGVVVLAIGAHKAATILSIVSSSLANLVVIDVDLGEELLKLLDGPPVRLRQNQPSATRLRSRSPHGPKSPRLRP